MVRAERVVHGSVLRGAALLANRIASIRYVHASIPEVRGRSRLARRAGRTNAEMARAVREPHQRRQRADALHHPLQLERLARNPVVHVRRHVPVGGRLRAQAWRARSRRRLLQQDVAANAGLGRCRRDRPVPDADGCHYRLAVDPDGRELVSHPGAFVGRRRAAALADQDHDPARLRAACPGVAEIIKKAAVAGGIREAGKAYERPVQ